MPSNSKIRDWMKAYGPLTEMRLTDPRFTPSTAFKIEDGTLTLFANPAGGSAVATGISDNGLIVGRAGDARLVGGEGRYGLSGGVGADVFVFGSAADIGIGAGRDRSAHAATAKPPAANAVSLGSFKPFAADRANGCFDAAAAP